MALAPHTRLGTYEILAPLGSGGMGEVYRARDAKLDRDVALKVLSEGLSRDPESLARFEREAKAVAALSHPNILAIHDFGVEGGIVYAVTELLEGEPMHLERGALDQYRNAEFLPDGERVLLEATEPGHAPRCYEQRLSGGPPRAVTPEGTTRCSISPDGSRVLARAAEGRWSLYPLAGGEPVPVRGILPEERVSRFAPDGRSLVVYQGGRMPARVTRVDLSDGRRSLLKEIAPPDLVGALSVNAYLASDDGKSYVYAYFRYLTQLYLVDGVR